MTQPEITAGDRGAARATYRMTSQIHTQVNCNFEHEQYFAEAFARHRQSSTEELRAEVERLREGMRKLMQSAKMLHTNAAGCAANHYGHDFEEHGSPQWLDDCLTDIKAAYTLLSNTSEKDG